MKESSTDRNKSRRKTPWDKRPELTPTQEFISKQYEEHYMQRHPKLEETGEVELSTRLHLSKAHTAVAQSFKSTDIPE